MEKAVKSHLWLDRTQNSYVKTLFPRHMRDIPCAHTFIFVSSEIMSVGKNKIFFVSTVCRLEQLCQWLWFHKYFFQSVFLIGIFQGFLALPKKINNIKLLTFGSLNIIIIEKNLSILIYFKI